jgi:uncharacterized membrane protein
MEALIARAERRGLIHAAADGRARSRMGVFTLLLSVVLFWSSSAFTSVKFCNAAPEAIQVALAFQRGAQWHVKGWTTVSPATCGVIDPNANPGQDVHYWAHMGMKREWGAYGANANPWQLCVLEFDDFDYVFNGQDMPLRDGPRPCADYGEKANLRYFEKISSNDNGARIFHAEGGVLPPEFQQSAPQDLQGKTINTYQTFELAVNRAGAIPV